MDPLVLSVLYVWCQVNKDMIVQFWFGMQFKVRFCCIHLHHQFLVWLKKSSNQFDLYLLLSQIMVINTAQLQGKIRIKLVWNILNQKKKDTHNITYTSAIKFFHGTLVPFVIMANKESCNFSGILITICIWMIITVEPPLRGHTYR